MTPSRLGISATASLFFTTALCCPMTNAKAQEMGNPNCVLNIVDPLNPSKRVGEDSINLSLQSLANEIEAALPANSPIKGMTHVYLSAPGISYKVALVRGAIRGVPSPLSQYTYVRQAEDVLLSNLREAEARARECTQSHADASKGYLNGYTASNTTVVGEGGIVHYDNEKTAPEVAEARPFAPQTSTQVGTTQVLVTTADGGIVVAMDTNYWNQGTSREGR